MITTQGIDHIGLSVRDLPATTDFFVETLGFQIIGGREEYPAIFISDDTVMITLWQTHGAPADFDRHANVGLHHLALRVGSLRELDEIHDVLSRTEGVEIECAPIPLESGGAHMMCVEPGGIRIEFIARAG